MNPGYNVVQIQNLLAEHADVLRAGTQTTEQLLADYGISPDSYVAQLARIAEHVYHTLPRVKPSDAFVEALYQELVDSPNPTLWEWLRQLPLDHPLGRLRELPRSLQLAAGAAGLTITAGVFWFASRARRDAILAFISSLSTSQEASIDDSLEQAS